MSEQLASAQHIAQATRDAMLLGDRATQSLGMQVLAIGPGTASLSMRVRDDMLNGHGSCHGGLISTLADSAFAFACNSHNEVTVASGFDINLLAAAKLGDVLTASATERHKAGRTGLYEVAVHNQQGALVAVFSGRSYTLKGQAVVPGLPVGKAASRSPGA